MADRTTMSIRSDVAQATKLYAVRQGSNFQQTVDELLLEALSGKFDGDVDADMKMQLKLTSQESLAVGK